MGRAGVKHKLYRINHKERYVDGNIHTNNAENVFGCLRKLEDILRHIAQNYFDLYVSQVAWRLTTKAWTLAERFTAVMAAMTAPKRSKLAGYFQGQKRTCPVIQKDGSIEGYRLPPRKKRKTPQNEQAVATPA